MEMKRTTELSVECVLKASREKVWEALTDPELIKQWMSPNDFTVPIAKVDLRIGGKMIWCMRDKEGKDTWAVGTFIELVPPKRLVYADNFGDPEGNIVPASTYGFDASFPEKLTVTFLIEEFLGKTHLVLNHSGFSEDELMEMTRQGWEESFGKLAVLLEGME